MLRPATLRAAERTYGKELYTYIIGNAPVALWCEDITEDTVAPQKVYFQKGIIVDPYNTGPVMMGKNVQDYVWARKEEIPEYVSGDEAYLEFLEKLLIV